MNIEFDNYKQKLNDCRPALEGLADSLNLEGLRAMQEAPGFWDDPDKSQKTVKQVKVTEYKVERYEKMLASWDDLMTICEMAAEEDDDSMLDELKLGFEELEYCQIFRSQIHQTATDRHSAVAIGICLDYAQKPAAGGDLRTQRFIVKFQIVQRDFCPGSL